MNVVKEKKKMSIIHTLLVSENVKILIIDIQILNEHQFCCRSQSDDHNNGNTPHIWKMLGCNVTFIMQCTENSKLR